MSDCGANFWRKFVFFTYCLNFSLQITEQLADRNRHWFKRPECTGTAFRLEFLLRERRSGLVVTSKLASGHNSLPQRHKTMPVKPFCDVLKSSKNLFSAGALPRIPLEDAPQTP